MICGSQVIVYLKWGRYQEIQKSRIFVVIPSKYRLLFMGNLLPNHPEAWKTQLKLCNNRFSKRL